MSELFESQEQMLNGFLDGELDAAQEEQLFTSLADNAEMRSELRDMRAVQTAARNYAATVTAPAEFTKSVCTRLGFQSITSTTTTIVGSTFALALLGFLKKYWIPLSAVLVGSVLTSWYFLSMDSMEKQSGHLTPAVSRQDASPAASDKKHDISPSETSTSSLPARNPPITKTKSSEPASPSTTHASSDVRLRATNMRSRQTDGTALTSEDESLRSVDTHASATALPDSSASSMESSDALHLFLEPFASFENISASSEIATALSEFSIGNMQLRPVRLPENFSVEYRSYSLKSTPEETIAPKSDPWFREMSIAFQYRLAPQHSIGVVIGHEAFPQHYNGIENGIGVQYEQSLLTPWIAGEYSFRIASLRFLGSIDPFITLNLGSTMQAWALTRGMAGIRYVPVRPVSIMIGFEGSLLLYQFQSSWFTTKKTGLVYGIAFQF